MTTNFDALPEFQKEYKKLGKKYKSLPDDLKEFQKVLSVEPLGNRKHFNVVTQTEAVHIVKARLFCRYLKGSSLRIIYAYHKQKQQFEYIELYSKGDKANEDRTRIQEYIKNH